MTQLEALYLWSNLVAMSACFIVAIMMGSLSVQAQRQRVPLHPIIPGCVVRICRWLILLFGVMGAGFLVEILNFQNRLNIPSGRYRNFIVAFTVAGSGLPICRNLRRILHTMHFERGGP